MMRRYLWSVTLILCHFSTLFAQTRVGQPVEKPNLASVPTNQHVNIDLRNTHDRLVAVVPMIGKGTPDDPRRPAYTPGPRKKGDTPSLPSIIAFSYVMADDGNHAIVEYVAMDRAAFASILADKSPDVKSFQRGQQKREDIELELKKHKKDLNLDRLGVRIP